MKIAKRILISLFVLLILLLGTAIAIPYFFRDELVAMAREEANKAVNAEVSFADVNLSLLRSFPDFSLRIDSFSVVGKDAFKGVPLASGSYAALTLDLMSVLRSSEPVAIKSVHLEMPELNILILKNGSANYDIMLPTAPTAEETTTAESDYGNLVVELASYSISGGKLIYDDHSLDTYLEIQGLDHSGSGNFTIDIYDLDTQTDIEFITVAQDGITYLDGAKADLDALFSIDSPNSKYTLKDNQLTINALRLNGEGYIQMNGGDILMELEFNSPQNEFRHLLSLVPNAFIEGYESVDASGKFTLEGNVSGVYNSTSESFPAFNFSTTVSNGRVKYPDLPLGIDNINTRAIVKSPTSNFDDLVIEVPRFAMALGNNPFEASFGLRTPVSDPNLQASANGRINLGELQKAFPMEGIEDLSGLIIADLNINTRLSFIEKEAYEQVNMSGNLQVKDINYQATGLPKVEVREASMEFSPQYVDLSSFEARLGESDLQASGRIDNILAYFSPEKTMTGQMKVSSNYFDAGAWIPEESASAATVADTTSPVTDGAVFDRFDFELEAEAKTLLYDIYKINDAGVKGRIRPNLLRISNISAKIGESDFSGKGVITSLFDYLFGEGILGGDLSLTSNRLNLNEFMPEAAPENSSAETPGEAYGVIPVPPNIDMEIMADIGELIYTNINLKNVNGHLVIAEETIILDNVRARGLGGDMAMSGSYETTDPEEPAFSFKYNLANLEFQEAFNTFNTFEKLAPIGKNLRGQFNSTLIMDGKLGKDLYPKLSTLNAEGFLQTIDAVLQQFKPLQAIGNKLQVNELKENIPVKNTKNWFEVRNGTLELKEYDARVAGIDMKIGGTYSVVDLMNLNIKAQVPREKLSQNALGAAADSGLKFLESQASKLGLNISQSQYVNVGINLKGAIEDPKVALKLLGLDGNASQEQSIGGQAKEQARETIDQKVEQGKQAAEAAAKKAADSLKNLAEQKAQQAAEDLKNQATDAVKNQLDSAAQQKASEVLDQVGKKTTDKIKEDLEKFNPFKKRNTGGGGGGQ